MIRRKIATMTTILLIGGGAIFAQVRTDVRERRDDLRDLARLESIASRYDAARAAKDEAALRAVRVELGRAARVEVAEGRAEMARAKAEARRREREQRSSEPELTLSIMADGAPAEGEARPSLRDDQRDAAREVKTQQRRLEIAGQLHDLGGSTELATLDRERALIGELVTLARQEVVQDPREVKKDRREIRE